MIYGKFTVTSIKKHTNGSSVVELAHVPVEADDAPIDPKKPPVPILQGRFDMHVDDPKQADTYKVGQTWEVGLGRDGELTKAATERSNERTDLDSADRADRTSQSKGARS
jgi:hypothetical protein